jgi:N4-gp56 family major capsid protein
MATKTHAAYGDSTNMIQQAVGLFAAHMQRNGTIARLTGAMPKGTAGAEATIRKQSSATMPIVRCQDLSKQKGDEVSFHLVNPVGAKPIMGSRQAEGRGTGVGISEDRLRVNQARFPIDLGDAMTSVRSPVDLRALGRPIAQSLMDRYIDQSLFVQMAGARGYHSNIDWVVPTDTDKDFEEIMVNAVKAPTRNRHFVAGSDAIVPFADAVSAGALNVATTDQLKMGVVDALRAQLEQMGLPLPPVVFEGDKAASDSPLRVLLVSPAQYNTFATDSQFRQLQASAIARASQANQHPLFLGEAGLWNGILIIKMPKPIRFYAGDTIKYCAAYDSDVESSVTVPDSFGKKFAIDRALLLGGQAVAEALAASDKSGIPFFWSEVELDHKDKAELLIGTIRGTSKIRFEIDTGAGKQFTDYGVMAIDTAVPIIGERQ